jgi:hypothetical protein
MVSRKWRIYKRLVVSRRSALYFHLHPFDSFLGIAQDQALSLIPIIIVPLSPSPTHADNQSLSGCPVLVVPATSSTEGNSSKLQIQSPVSTSYIEELRLNRDELRKELEVARLETEIADLEESLAELKAGNIKFPYIKIQRGIDEAEVEINIRLPRF